MSEISDLDVTDASNTARFPENMPPGNVNDSARALEGLLARGFKDAVESNLTSAGSANAYTLTPNRNLTAYYQGLRFQFIASFANTGAATLNVSSLGAKNIYKPAPGGLAALTGGEIRTNQVVDVIYDGTQFALLSPPAVPHVIEQATISTPQATLDITIPSGYSQIEIELIDFVPVTDNVSLYLRVQDNAAFKSGATDYIYGARSVGSVSAAATLQSNGAPQILLADAVGSASAEGLNATIKLPNPGGGSLRKNFRWQAGYCGQAAEDRQVDGAGSYSTTANDVEAVRFLFSSGNIESGQYIVRGLPS